MPNETQLDQQVIAMAKAIRQHETGNRQVAGSSGEMASRYQFLPDTWKAGAAKYLGDANAPVTLENENKVAYYQIKEWKDKGYNPGQIAAAWNAGEGSLQGDRWKTMQGVNKYGVKYDVPRYVNSVYSNYQKFKPVNTAQQPVSSQPIKQEQSSGILNTLQNIPTSILRGITQPGEFFARLGQTAGSKLADAAAGSSVGSAIRKVAAATGQTENIQRATQDLAKGLQGQDVVLPGQTDAVMKAVTPFKSVKEGIGEAGEAALNLGLAALPAGKVGGAALKALGVKQGLLTAGKQFIPRVLEAGAVGAGYTTAGALKEDRLPTAGELFTGATVGAAFPILGAGISGVAKATTDVRNKAAKSVINSLIKPLSKDFAYGKDPAAGALGIVAKDFGDLVGQLETRVSERGAKIQQALSNPKVSAQIVPTIRNAYKPLDDAIQLAATNGEQSVVNRLKTLKDALMFEQSADDAGNIIRGNARKMEYVNPAEIVDAKRRVGELTKFTGNPSDDKAVNTALRKVYGNLKGISEEAALKGGVNIKKLNEDFANSMSALVAARNRDVIMQRQNLLSLANKLTSGAGIITSILTGNPVAALLSGSAGVLVDKLLSSTAAKTIFAKWLMVASPEEKIRIFQKVPVLRNALDRIFGADVVENPLTPEAQNKLMLLLPEKAGPSAGIAQVLPSKGILEGQAKLADIPKPKIKPTAMLSQARANKMIKEQQRLAATPLSKLTKQEADSIRAAKKAAGIYKTKEMIFKPKVNPYPVAKIRAVKNLSEKAKKFITPEDLINAKKQEKLSIILKSNPATDTYHTWIRKLDDIKTPEEAFINVNLDDNYVYPDFTQKMGEAAYKSGKIKVYSSKKIKDGIFVTPSKMQAEDYAGGGKIFEKEVSIDDVAWINSDEGQYAKSKRY